MLGKLLKYDLKNTMKFLFIFYSIALFLCILTRLFINSDSPYIVFIIGRILSGTLISMFASVIINCLMRLWLKTFSQGVYGDESYLTHTLPVTKKQICLSKFFCAVISAAVSLAVILLCAFIAYYTDARWQLIKNMFFGEGAAALTWLTVVVVFLEFVNLIQCGFTGIILGHRRNSGKAGLSVLFAVLYETATQIAVLIFAGLAALIGIGEFRGLFGDSPNTVPKEVFYYIIPVYLAVIIFTLFLDIKLLSRGVDVE